MKTIVLTVILALVSAAAHADSVRYSSEEYKSGDKVVVATVGRGQVAEFRDTGFIRNSVSIFIVSAPTSLVVRPGV